METDTTNPVEGSDTALATASDEQGVDLQEAETETLLDDDGNPIEEPTDEEIELDEGLKLKVPKDAAQKVREGWLRQADYTRKTTELAEQRRAFEQERATTHQASEAELTAFAQASSFGNQVAQLDRQAQQYGGWAAWAREDPFAANEAYMARGELDGARQHAMNSLAGLRQQRLSHQQQETAKQIEQGRAALASAIPGYSDDLKAKLTGFAAGFGFSQQELADVEADPRVVKVLHAAWKASETEKKTAAANKHVRAQQVQPAATVSARAAPPQGLDDRLGKDEWFKRREAQVRKRA
jgi:hypothetical protein